jgi:hypothetical protein
MLGFLLSLSAEEILISPVEYRLLEAQEYDLQLTPGRRLGKIYAKLSFEVSQAELEEADFYSLFLACCVTIDRMKINGKEAEFFITTDLHPLHFAPELSRLELIEAGSPVVFYSFDPSLFNQEQNTVYIEYQMPMPPWQTAGDGSEVLSLGDIPFFYPHNLYSPAELSVSVHTTTFYRMEDADQTIDNGNLRIIRKKIVDLMDEDIHLDLIKVLN